MRFLRPFRERNPIVVGLVSIAVLTVAMLFAFSLNQFTFLTGRYIIAADFADAAGLVAENEVRVAGLKVGKVRSIELTDEAGRERPRVRDRVRVTMEIDSNVQLGRASTAEIKLKTLLGSKFVAVTQRGGRPYLEPGDVIPLERTMIPFEIYQVQNQTVASLGELDGEALNNALRELAAVVDDPEGDFGRALDGLARATAALSERDAELESLLANADVVSATLASRSEELGRILESGAALLGELQQRRSSLKAFVRGTDRVASQLSSLLEATRSSLDPALRDLHTTLEVVAANQGDLEDAVRVLSVDSESFGRVFTQGTWGDVFLSSAFFPSPGAPGESPLSVSGGVASIFGVTL